MSSQTASEPHRARADDDEVGLNGWQAFAAIVLFLNGFFSILYGLTAILNDDVLLVGGRGVVVLDFTTWGVVLMVVGTVMVLVSLGLFNGSGAARVAAIVIVGVHALVQFGTVSAFPLWSLLVIALDVVVIYQLTAKWRPA